MKTFSQRSFIAALAALTAACVSSSCSLPPREAWRQIDQVGLIAFLRNQANAPAPSTQSRPAPAPAVANVSTSKPTLASNSAQFVGPPTPATASVNVVKPAPVVTPAPAKVTSQNIMPAKDKPLMASSVPSLPGFVRSPYTIPPRLVDVKGATPGATMICPYTQRPFIIPSDFVNLPAGTLFANSNSTSDPAKPMPQPPVIAVQNNAPATPSPATTSAPSASKESIPVTPPPATNPPASALFSNNAPNNSAANTAASKPTTPEIPYGMPIPNRPGFVNSPFALKHQLVDVTGLPVGMEVKCPYTGKLFKVPAMDVAEQKAVASPGAPPAPEKAEKK